MTAGGQGFEADAERLGAHAAEFEGLAQRADRIAATLRDALDAAGEPWGGDEVGQNFAAAHAEPAADALARVSGLAGGLGEFGGKFGEAARRYAGTDDAAAGELGDAGSGLGPGPTG